MHVRDAISAILSILAWAPMMVLKLALVLLGLITVPAGILVAKGDYSRWPKLLWLWGNDQDGLGPTWWQQRLKDDGFKSQFLWLAVRNPANNLRYLFKEPPYYRHATGTIGKFQWDWRRYKLISGFRIWTAGFEFYIGFKVGLTVPGLGFTSQFRWGET